MIGPLKYILLATGAIGTVAITTPAIMIQLPRSLESYKVSAEVQCHGNKAFALVLGDEVKAWAGSEEDLVQSNQQEHSGRGNIISWNGSPCPDRSS